MRYIFYENNFDIFNIEIDLYFIIRILKINLSQQNNILNVQYMKNNLLNHVSM